MLINELIRYKGLGVINRTPNSFSCKGMSLNEEIFFGQLNSILQSRFIIPDIGFESTAPMNIAISHQEEISRFEEFLYLTKKIDFNNKIISFDTYKIDSFEQIFFRFKSLHPRVRFIFNDVSGVIDDDFYSFLKLFKNYKNDFIYSYSFTNVPSRDQTLSHLNFINQNDSIIDQCISAFYRVRDLFINLNLESNLILDPAFGFSKTYEQNWELINESGRLFSGLKQRQINNPILIGLSKKSFLRRYLNTADVNETEELHKQLLIKLRSISLNYGLNSLYRVHNINILSDL